MSRVVDPSAIILRDFMIGVLVLPTQLRASRPSPKLRFSSGDAKLQKDLVISTESEDGIWATMGGVKVPTTARDLKVSILIEEHGLIDELCHSTIACAGFARHARTNPTDPYEILLEDDTSSILLLVTCMTRIPPSRDIFNSNQTSAPVSTQPFGGSNFNSPMQNTTLSYQGPYDLRDLSSARMSPERLQLEIQYNKARNLPLDSRARALNAIGSHYLAILERRSDSALLDRTISILDEAVQCATMFDHRRGEYLADLSLAHHTRFKRTGDMATLNGAITAGQEAVAITEEGGPYQAQAFNVYGMAVAARYEQLGNIEDLQVAIIQYEKAVKSSSDSLQSTLFLNNLANAFLRRFNRTRDLQDIEAAIVHFQKAVEFAPDNLSAKPGMLHNLGVTCMMRFDHLGRIEDIDRAIRYNQSAVNLTPNDHPLKSDMLHSLANAFQSRFGREGSLEDLEVAIHHLQSAANLTPADHPHKPGRLSALGSLISRRFDRLGRLEDIEAAVHHQQMAFKLTPANNPDRPAILSSLGNVLRKKFNRLGNLEDLETAIRHAQSAVDLIPDGHPDKAGSLNNLGEALEMRFGRLDRIEDIEAAIRHKQMTVKLTPANHPEKPARLGNLGNAFGKRFNRLGNLEDLETAIRYKQMAVDLRTDGHPDKPLDLNNLAEALETRFARLGRIEDIEAAIRYMELSVKLIPDNHPLKPSILHNLASFLDTRFVRSKRMQDVEASISHRRMVVKLTPEGHSERPTRLIGLGYQLRIRYRHLHDINDLEEAIANYKTALDLLPEDHPTKPYTLAYLGTACYDRYQKLKQPDDLKAAYDYSSSVANLVSVRPAYRLSIAKQWALFSIMLGMSPLPAYRVAIDMLPRIAWLGLPIHGQHALLEEVGEVVRDAIGDAIESEDYELAVEWVEAGRSIAWQNFLNLRTPLDELRQKHPELAELLHSISQQLEVTGRSQASEQGQVVEIDGRSSTQLALDWDNAVEEVRSKPGFESFLKTKRFSQFADVTREGPIVILNVQERRCAALLLIPEEGGSVYTTSIPLPLFSFILSKALYLVLIDILTIGHVRDRNELAREDRKVHRVVPEHADGTNLETVLRILWNTVVKPVIEALAYEPRTTDLPHIWWCATGPLAFLPIHAAGLYDAEHEEPGHKLLDYVVSSYTPTLSALFDNSTPSKDVKFLAVAQANAPGASRIPNTEVEVERIMEVATNVSLTTLIREEATIESVLEGMEKSSWVHLACHGQQNAEQPMKSGLLLHNGKLELERLIAKPLPNADFAFLSACQTATGDEKVAEESVHLAAGMLFSGYKGVIATMWSINDNIAPQIAEDVYRYMLADGKPDRKKAAHALHYAVKRLRESKADVLTWVPFIHIGR